MHSLRWKEQNLNYYKIGIRKSKMEKKEIIKNIIEIIEKKQVIRYLAISAICIVLISMLLIFRGGPTGFAVYFEGPEAGQTTLMLQTADSDNLGDAYVVQGQLDTNYGSDNDLIVKLGSSDSKNSYLNFNISAIPDNQIIDNSSLCVYLYNDRLGSVIISAYHVYDNFDEAVITWNNQPCGTDFNNSNNCNLTAESSLANDGAQDNTWQCWDITNMVNTQYSNEDNNISIVLHTGNIATYADFFRSKEYTIDTSLIPYLNITYHTANTAPSLNLVNPQ